jgi:hypothetical protein
LIGLASFFVVNFVKLAFGYWCMGKCYLVIVAAFLAVFVYKAKDSEKKEEMAIVMYAS